MKYNIIIKTNRRDDFLITVFLANFVRFKICYHRRRMADILLIIYKNKNKSPEIICDIITKNGIYKHKQCARNTLSYMRKLNILEKEKRGHIAINPEYLEINLKY